MLMFLGVTCLLLAVAHIYLFVIVIAKGRPKGVMARTGAYLLMFLILGIALTCAAIHEYTDEAVEREPRIDPMIEELLDQ